MATVIDSLVISLSLDASKFDASQRMSMQNLRRFEEQAKTSGTNVETSAKKMVDGFSNVTKEILGLGAAILGVSGLKDLLVNTVQTSAALGRQASVLDVNTEALNRWVNAARLAGVASGVAQGSIASLVTRLGALRTGQATPSELGARALAALGITNADFANWEHFLLQVSKGLQQPQAPGVRAALADEIPSIGPLMPLLQRGPEAVQAFLRESTTATKEQTDAAQRLVTEMTRLILAMEKLTNALIPKIEGPATGVIHGIKEITQGNVLKGLREIDQATSFSWVPGNRPIGAPAAAATPPPAGPFSGATLFRGFRSSRDVGYGTDFGRFSSAREGIPGGWVAPYLQAPIRPAAAGAEGFTRGGDTSNDNSRTVHIGSIHIDAPPGADPFQFGKQVSAAIQAAGGGR